MSTIPPSQRPRTAKVLLLGDASVGKTSLRSRYVRHTFSSAYRATINSDFLTTTMDGINLQIWDTAGQERFNSVGTAFYRGADVAILCYDITKGSTFTNLKKWAANVVEHSKSSNLVLIIAGNKKDLEDYSVISERQVSEFAKEWGARYFFVSAKDNDNVDDLFRFAAEVSTQQPQDLSKLSFEPVEIENPALTSRGSGGSCC